MNAKSETGSKRADAILNPVLTATAANPAYGYRRISDLLLMRGVADATRYRVRRVMAYLAQYRIDA
jgi:hypothetical protein